jgi:hypothetical protein
MSECTNCACTKRQSETIKGVKQHRCINNASSFFTLPVVESQCSSCPVAVLMRDRRPCSEKLEQAPLIANPISPPGFPACTERRADGSEYKCGVTGLPVDPEICNRCNRETHAEVQGLGSKMFGYFDAIRRWIAAGRPVRSDEEVERIFTNECLKCDRFDAETQTCNSCGCALKMAGTPLTNKIKMASERCPLGRW